MDYITTAMILTFVVGALFGVGVMFGLTWIFNQSDKYTELEEQEEIKAKNKKYNETLKRIKV